MKIIVNYYGVYDENGNNVLKDVGSKAEIKELFQSYKKQLRKQGYTVTGNFEDGTYTATRGKEKRNFFVRHVDYVAQE